MYSETLAIEKCEIHMALAVRTYKTAEKLHGICLQIFSANIIGDVELRTRSRDVVNATRSEMADEKDDYFRMKKELVGLKRDLKTRVEQDHDEYKQSIGWG